jgi:hypothetical protein
MTPSTPHLTGAYIVTTTRTAPMLKAATLTALINHRVLNALQTMHRSGTIAGLANGMARTHELKTFLANPMHVTNAKIPAVVVSVFDAEVAVGIAGSVALRAHMVTLIDELFTVLPRVPGVTLALLDSLVGIEFPVGMFYAELTVAWPRAVASVADWVAGCHVHVTPLSGPEVVAHADTLYV